MKPGIRGVIIFCLVQFWAVTTHAKNAPFFEAIIQPRFQIELVSPVIDSSYPEWDIHRAVLEFSSGGGEKTGFCLSADITEKQIIKDAYVLYRPHKNFNIRLGRARPAFGYDLQKEPEDLLLIANSRASSFTRDVAGSSRNVGLEIAGSLPLMWQYKLGYYDSPNYTKAPLTFAELISAQIGWIPFEYVNLIAGLRTETFRQHRLLLYRSSFFDLALITDLFKNRWHSEVELFYGDAALRDYLMGWNDDKSFVTVSLRVLSGFSFNLHKQVICPIISVEHYDDGFATAQVYTGGIRWDSGKAFSLNLEGEFTRKEKINFFEGRKLSFQGTYVFRKKM